MSESKQPPKPGTTPSGFEENRGEDLSRILNALSQIQQTAESTSPVSKPSPPPSGPAQK